MTTDSTDGSEIAQMNVYQRMAVAQNIFRYVQKPNVDGMNFRPVLHDDVAKAARAALLAARMYAEPTTVSHGQEGNYTWALVRTDYVNIDNPEDRFSVEMFGYGNNRNGFGPGIAISYACKFCHLKAFGVECGEDAEAEHPDNMGVVQAPVTVPQLIGDLRAATKDNGLDGEHVAGRILEVYGLNVRNQKKLGADDLDCLATVVASVQDEPHSWKVDPEVANA